MKLKTLKNQSSKLAELRKSGGAKNQKVLDFRTIKPVDDIEEFKMANGKLSYDVDNTKRSKKSIHKPNQSLKAGRDHAGV